MNRKLRPFGIIEILDSKYDAGLSIDRKVVENWKLDFSWLNFLIEDGDLERNFKLHHFDKETNKGTFYREAYVEAGVSKEIYLTLDNPQLIPRKNGDYFVSPNLKQMEDYYSVELGG